MQVGKCLYIDEEEDVVVGGLVVDEMVGTPKVSLGDPSLHWVWTL